MRLTITINNKLGQLEQYAVIKLGECLSLKVLYKFIAFSP